MNADVKAKWIKALRSGKYEQGRGGLSPDKRKYCCLGVLCDLYRKEHPKWQAAKWERGRVAVGAATMFGKASFLPDRVIKWAGLTGKDPSVSGSSLSDHNDGAASTSRKSFLEIANLIEAEL